MDEYTQTHPYRPPSRGGAGNGWIIGAAVVFVLLVILFATIGGAPDGTAPTAATPDAAPAATTDAADPAAPASTTAPGE